MSDAGKRKVLVQGRGSEMDQVGPETTFPPAKGALSAKDLGRLGRKPAESAVNPPSVPFISALFCFLIVKLLFMRREKLHR